MNDEFFETLYLWNNIVMYQSSFFMTLKHLCEQHRVLCSSSLLIFFHIGVHVLQCIYLL